MVKIKSFYKGLDNPADPLRDRLDNPEDPLRDRLNNPAIR